MPLDERLAAHLWDMLTIAERLSSLVVDPDAPGAHADWVVQLAVERLTTNLGEAARRVPEEFRVLHPEIPWRGLAGQRDRLVHNYDDVVPEILYRNLGEGLPSLIDLLRQILEPDWPAEDA